MNSFEISGQIVDVVAGEIFGGVLTVRNGRVDAIRRDPAAGNQLILPGLIDAHIHIESSMLVPSEFARAAVPHGTVGVVSDPHEIANVLGIDGVRFMIGNSRKVPLKFRFGAPSCVPATPFETSGAVLGPAEVRELLEMPEVGYLSEMMNFPGVIHGDKDVLAKPQIAAELKKPVDGHAPGLSGPDLQRYVSAGISTDHECVSIDEAREKLAAGMKILIREGSAAKNLDALLPLIDEAPDRVMLCSDDRHPRDLERGHINLLLRRVIRAGIDPLRALRICTLNPKKHYGLDTGLLQPGDPADFIVIDNFEDFTVKQIFIDGVEVSRDGQACFVSVPIEAPNVFAVVEMRPEQFRISAQTDSVKVIEARNGQLLTGKGSGRPRLRGGFLESDPRQDLLKISVCNRYRIAEPQVGFVRGFGLKRGAIASTVAHDSHNIVAVGCTDRDICAAVNALVNERGGIAVADDATVSVLPLPVAGLMSDRPVSEVASQFEALEKKVGELGGTLDAPFMTLSFMSLLVIPELKIGDGGLFDVTRFEFVSLFNNGKN